MVQTIDQFHNMLNMNQAVNEDLVPNRIPSKSFQSYDMSALPPNYTNTNTGDQRSMRQMVAAQDDELINFKDTSADNSPFMIGKTSNVSTNQRVTIARQTDRSDTYHKGRSISMDSKVTSLRKPRGGRFTASPDISAKHNYDSQMSETQLSLLHG